MLHVGQEVLTLSGFMIFIIRITSSILSVPGLLNLVNGLIVFLVRRNCPLGSWLVKYTHHPYKNMIFVGPPYVQRWGVHFLECLPLSIVVENGQLELRTWLNFSLSPNCRAQVYAPSVRSLIGRIFVGTWHEHVRNTLRRPTRLYRHRRYKRYQRPSPSGTEGIFPIMKSGHHYVLLRNQWELAKNVATILWHYVYDHVVFHVLYIVDISHRQNLTCGFASECTSCRLQVGKDSCILT
jgi:hypothetical protein